VPGKPVISVCSISDLPRKAPAGSPRYGMENRAGRPPCP
jgi:hypothetical protein